jgi:hypothetical protein
MTGRSAGASRNDSSKYPTIGQSATSGMTILNCVIRNLNPEFNVVRLQTLMESIQCLAPTDSPLVALVQQGADIAEQIEAVRPPTTSVVRTTSHVPRQVPLHD